MIGGRRPLLRENLADADPSPCKTPIFTRSSDENSVRLSVTRVNCDKTQERSVQILYHKKDNLA